MFCRGCDLRIAFFLVSVSFGYRRPGLTVRRDNAGDVPAVTGERDTCGFCRSACATSCSCVQPDSGRADPWNAAVPSGFPHTLDELSYVTTGRARRIVSPACTGAPYHAIVTFACMASSWLDRPIRMPRYGHSPHDKRWTDSQGRHDAGASGTIERCDGACGMRAPAIPADSGRLRKCTYKTGTWQFNESIGQQ